jgi:hypothetical protein
MLAAAMSGDGKDAMEPGFAAAEIDTSRPHPARMYNAYLGVILSFRVSQGCGLRCPVMDSVADGTLAA